MEDLNIISFIISGLSWLAMYFMKIAHDQTKDQLKSQQQEIKELRDTSYRREDFKEFKDELFKRLDKIEDDLKAQRMP